jgi:dephospho-CoA kinase
VKPTRHKGTLVVGIAGGSGTGKSTVAAHLVGKFGGVHVDGDRIAHTVLDDERVRDRIRAEFGPDVFDADGRVDRRRLGRLVFADSSRLGRLNAIMHPAIVARCAEEVERARATAATLVVVDAALLLEVAVPFAFDIVIALRADREERRRRLLAQGGHGEAEIGDRLDRQEGMEKHFYKADAVVDTGRDLASVLSDAEGLVEAALRRTSRKS